MKLALHLRLSITKSLTKEPITPVGSRFQGPFSRSLASLGLVHSSLERLSINAFLPKFERHSLVVSLLAITEADMAGSELTKPAPNSSLADTGSDLNETAAELDDNPTNGLHIEGAPFALEHIYDYEAGGHHPIQLGDVFDNGRYRVIHKLGSGGYANVWLCLDLAAPTPKYVALKILMAEASTEDCRELLCAEKLKDTVVADRTGPICAPLRHFGTDGPNGSHLCFVYPILGPKVSSGLLNSSKDPDGTLRGICHETVKAIALLHGLGICHGGQISLRCWIIRGEMRSTNHSEQTSHQPISYNISLVWKTCPKRRSAKFSGNREPPK